MGSLTMASNLRISSSLPSVGDGSEERCNALLDGIPIRLNKFLLISIVPE